MTSASISIWNRFTRAFTAFVAMLLAVLSACSNASEAESGTLESPLLGTYPAQPDFSDEELEQIASSEEVQSMIEPFSDAPPPDESWYVTMRDGTRIAVSLYFPPGFDRASGKAPATYSETWYMRSREAGGTAIDLYRSAGNVVVIADPRGFGASFGSQSGYITQEQRDDQREMIAWLASRPWSNGSVTAVGISVSAMVAEAMLASGAPNLKAGIIRSTEWDQYTENLYPGGIPNGRMHQLVRNVLGELNRAEGCIADAAACPQYGLEAVTGDEDFTLVRQALQDHQNNIAADALDALAYSDDSIGTTTFESVSPKGHAAELAKFAVPTRLSASWMDGTTAEGALGRYNALPNVPMQVSIGATTHMGGLNADPFTREPFAPAKFAPETAFGNDVTFVKRVLAGEKIERGIEYYVLGTDTWKHTPVWPPSDVRDRTLHLSAAGLHSHAVRHSGERSYAVDPTAALNVGRNRWSSQQDSPIYYGDLRFAIGEHASFDGRPFDRDAELVGAPELCLAMRSDQTDGTVFAYLEDVDSEGRSTYLTEGELRLLHRKTRTGGCDAARGTDRSFSRADAAPVSPGELMQVEIPMLPVAAKIQKGHYLRLSLAGADADTFPMISEAPGNWSIAYGGAHGSKLTVPLKAWTAN